MFRTLLVHHQGYINLIVCAALINVLTDDVGVQYFLKILFELNKNFTHLLVKTVETELQGC